MQTALRASRVAGPSAGQLSHKPVSAPQTTAKRHEAGRAHKLTVANDSKEKQAGQQQSVEDVLAAANALLDNLQLGQPSQASPGVMASIDELQALGYVCDESGCVLVLPDQQDDSASDINIGYLTGNSWSLGLRDDVPEAEEGEEPTPYTAEISGPAWSILLKPKELGDILGMLAQLRFMVANLTAQGQWLGGTAERPVSRVKRETSHIMLTATHSPMEPGFSLEITFKTSRRCMTCSWPADVAAAVITAVDKATGTASQGSTGRFERVPAPATVSA